MEYYLVEGNRINSILMTWLLRKSAMAETLEAFELITTKGLNAPAELPSGFATGLLLAYRCS